MRITGVAALKEEPVIFDEQKPLLLVVTDDLQRLTRLDDMLVREGHLVTTCSTLADAEKMIAGKRVDLVIVSKMGDVGEENALIWKV